MALQITDNEITSDETDVSAARRHPDHGTGWAVHGYPPNRVFDRNQAITAVTLAEERTKENPNLDLIEALEGEL